VNSRITSCLALAWVLVVTSMSAAAERPSIVKLGGMCDLTGSTKMIGAELCPGVVDYIALINKRGGVMGQRLSYTGLDHAYSPPRALEAFEQLRQDGVVALVSYGVPTLLAISQRVMDERIPTLNTGTGRADAIDGERFRYIFPGTSSYWSQAGLAMKYIKDMGARRGTRIAYLYVDNPAGREGEPMVELVAQKEGYELRSVPIQPPGLELDAQVREIVTDFNADWVIASIFGRAAGLAIKEIGSTGYPLSRVIGFVFASGETDVEAAGWENAQGYVGVQLAAVGRDLPIVQDIMKMMRDEGREVPRHVGSAYYNRGVLTGALIVEAVRQAIVTQGLPLTGDKVRLGFESIKNFSVQGLAPPLTITPQDHEGGGYLRLYQVRGRAWVPLTDWSRGYRDEVMQQVRKANAK